LEDLKGNYNANRLRKTEIEKTLSSIYDMEVRDKLQDLKKFERLNDEKPTLLFLNLAKKSKPDSQSCGSGFNGVPGSGLDPDPAAEKLTTNLNILNTYFMTFLKTCLKSFQIFSSVLKEFLHNQSKYDINWNIQKKNAKKYFCVIK